MEKSLSISLKVFIMINRYILGAVVAVLIVLGSYLFQFYITLNYSLSEKPEEWAQLGDYAGGLLNPSLTFISLVLLIKSLSLQNEANQSLRLELKNTEKTEKIRAFESLFFNLLSSQKEIFHSFNSTFFVENELIIKYKTEAVLAIEDEIEKIRDGNGSDNDVQIFLEKIDSNDQIFSVTRAFYIIVKLISDRLSNSDGFELRDRKSHLLTLINFTDFAQLRLVLISMQFLNFQSVIFLKNDAEFIEALEEVGLSFDLY